MGKEVQTQEYEAHIEEIQAGLAEYFKHRVEVDYEWRHKIGKLLLEYAETHKVSLRSHVCNVAQSIGKEMRTVYYMAAFAKKFPKLEEVPPEPWRDICHKYLTAPKQETKLPECNHSCKRHCL